MRYFCGVPRSCPLAGLSGDLGWVPGVVRRDLKCIRLFNQIVKMERSCLTHQILQSEWAECAPNSWAENVRNIIYSIGKQESWNNLSPVNVKDTKIHCSTGTCKPGKLNLGVKVNCPPMLKLMRNMEQKGT